jgi:hypothetical protein
MLSEGFIFLVFLFIRVGPLPLLFFQSYCGINFFRISFLGMTSGQDPLGKTRLDPRDNKINPLKLCFRGAMFKINPLKLCFRG